MKILILLALLSASIYSMDSVKCNQILSLMDEEKWEEAKSEMDAVKDLDDPEYYSLLLNYYFGQAKKSGLSISADPPIQNEEALSFTDSTGQKYYLVDIPSYDTAMIDEGLRQFKPALEKFPSRLDLHYGYVFASQQIGYYGEAEGSLINVLNISKDIENKWLWSYNKPVENAEAVMLTQMQGIIYRFFQAETAGADSAVMHISGKMIELYPGSAFGYNNIGSIYIANNAHDKALVYLLKAHKAVPGDALVMANLVDTYMRLENYDTAIYYLNKIVETGDEDLAPWAEEVLQEIGNAAEAEEVY